MSDLFDLTGEMGLITGAGGQLGYEHAFALLEKNASVVLCDVSLEGLKQNQSRLISFFPNGSISHKILDVTNEENIKLVQNEFPAITILINNAAINPKISKLASNAFESYDLEKWNSEILVGLTGAFLMSKYFGSKMAENGKGSIINIGSDLSVISPDQRIYQNIGSKQMTFKPVAYSVVKHGIVGLTKYLSTYWAESGVRVNTLSPGGIDFDLPTEFKTKVSNLIPMNRLARPDEYRGAIQFLASEASSYMTGQNLVIDGGRTVW